MLDVTYEATRDLAPGRLAQIDEDRGRIRVLLDQDRPLAEVIAQLNVEIAQLMNSARWFQLWDDEIVSSNTPDAPLRVEYLLRSWVPPATGAGVAEVRGVVRVYICPSISVAAFAAVMNPATEEHLAGGHWFQLYGGEIIDNSPEPVRKA